MGKDGGGRTGRQRRGAPRSGTHNPRARSFDRGPVIRGDSGALLVALHKPWGVLSRFTPDGSPHRTLAEFGMPTDLYPVGRLDADSEGLLLLSDESRWATRLLPPGRLHPRRYWVQVEGIPAPESLERLVRGVMVQGSRTRPCRAWLLQPPPVIAPRDPPIRFRKSVPDCWMALELVEGRNRQVRRMTATVGHPTLRLIRVAIGRFELGTLEAGRWRLLDRADEEAVLAR